MTEPHFAHLTDLVQQGFRIVLDTYTSVEKETVFTVAGAGVTAGGHTLQDALEAHQRGRRHLARLAGPKG